MAGESIISTGSIEKRAEEVETKMAAEKTAADKVEADRVAKEAADKEAAEASAAPKGSDGQPVVTKEKPGQPDDIKELRKWATRVSMENAEVKKRLDDVLAAFNKTAKKPLDLKELIKSPEKLQQAIDAREKELIEEHTSKFNENITQAAAEITQYESNARLNDKENYPRWGELMPLIKQLAAPTPAQPNGDPRVNFNQHPKLVLDELYDLAQDIANKDPNYKKPSAKAPTGKTFTQEELDAQVTKAREEAAAEASANLRKEANGAGVGGMGKGAAKGKPGAVDKEVLWNMPLSDLGNAIKKATEQLG